MDVDRRIFIAGSLAGALAPAAVRAQVAASPIGAALSPFVSRYMAAQHAPGMIVGMADAKGWSETARYGFADVEARRPIAPDERFHIGSITKSFTALMILQLVDEGRLALDADITTCLPDLPLRTPFAPVTVHHLLCHTSGLPSDAPAPGWPDQMVEQAYAPGARFHYCNLGYEWLGRIVVARGGEDWTRALHRRILDPLGMTQTSALIGAGMRHLEVPNYMRREDDRPFLPTGPLTRAGPQTFTAASGCIASTAADMNRYIALFARRGQGPAGRLLSPAGFALMTRRHVKAAELGPDAGYGYGWMIDKVDGAAVIRHTGGMNSFMSSIHVDLDAGVGAFASINTQQNYRPVPVTAYALRLCRARASGAALPRPPVFDPGEGLVARDYAGTYAGKDGTLAVVTAGAKGLTLALGGRTVTLQSLGDDSFASLDPGYRLFTFLFSRALPRAAAVEGKPNPVVTLGWGREAYVRRGAKPLSVAVADRVALQAAQLQGYEGLYAASGGWLTTVRVIARDSRLWVDTFNGVQPLASLGADRFRFADEPDSPETVAFSPAAVSPRTLSIGGAAMVRVGDPFMDLG